MATIKWDHLVHYVNDLEKTIGIFKENGLIALKGGSHKEWGTYNALSYFGLTYIEFLAIEDLALAKATEHNIVVKDAVTHLPEHEVLSRAVIRTDDIEEVAADLAEKGLELSPIIDGKRLDTHGRLIEWRMMTIKGNFHGLVYPFVIQWLEKDEERLVNLNNLGINLPHPAGDVAMIEAVFSVSNPKETAEHWAELFNLSIVESNDYAYTVGIGDKRFVFKAGNENQFKEVLFEAKEDSLKGKVFAIGEGKYRFC